MVISALWGICFFGELRAAAARALFAAASGVVRGGAVALKLAGGA